jgi:hypothetical protein
MKNGDKFYCNGNWNTAPGWWEVTRAEVDCGMVRAKPIGNPADHDWAKESEWHADYVEKAIERSNTPVE